MRGKTLPLLPALLLGAVLTLPAGAGAQNGPAHLELTYTGDLFANMAGGRKRGLVYLDNLDLTLTLDLDRLLGWPDLRLFLYGLGNQGGSVGRLVGDVQGVDNIEAPNAWQLYEAWIQHVGDDGHFSALVGLYDLNSEFDLIRSALLFMNSSHGIGPEFSGSGRNGPSIFPATSVAVRLRWLPADAVYVQAAMLDGVPGDPAHPGGTHIEFASGDGALLAVESGVYFGGGAGRGGEEEVPRRRVARFGTPTYVGRLALGLWGYTAPLPTFAAGTANAHSLGAYALSEWTPCRCEPSAGRVTLFARVGVARARTNRLASYLGAGAVWQGPLPTRGTDRVGLALARAYNGTPFRRARVLAGAPVERAETTLELTYMADVAPWLALQGDVQYVMDPGTDPTLSNALVVGVRFTVTP